MKENIKVHIGEKDFITTKDTKIIDFLKENKLDKNIIAAHLNKENEIVELSYPLIDECELELINKYTYIGKKMYISGLKYIYITAIKELYGTMSEVCLYHSIDKGIYTEIHIKEKVNENTLKEIKAKMQELISLDLPIEKLSATRKNAMDYFDKVHDYEKKETLKQNTAEYVTLYKLLNHYNYFFYYMPVSTGIIDKFELTLLENNSIILRYPTEQDKILPYHHLDKVLEEFSKYRKWSDLLDINYVSELNKKTIDGKINDFIQLNEIKQNADLSKIAQHVYKKRNTIKIVLIGGPSSSGKTTTSKKLSLSVRSRGLNPIVISTDDYFLDRKNTPKDKDGQYLFDILESIDVDMFNEQIKDLINGKEIIIPTFNFNTGEKEIKNKPIKMEENDILIIEGLHALNDKLLKGIKKENKYKIYISPFTPLGLNKHNHISTLDIRFLRRLVRDYKFRGSSAEDTFNKWMNVRKAEDEYIFPYQEEADMIVNTALIYEASILKLYAIPLLLSIEPSSRFFPEAIRLINFLKWFIEVPPDKVPETGLLREFIGNGYF